MQILQTKNKRGVEMNEDIIRPASVAGTFYPDEPDELKQMIEGFIDKAEDVEIDGELKGLVIPHAGYIYSGLTAAYGYTLLKKFSKKINDVIIAGPSHYSGFYGIAESGIGLWETPLGRVKARELKQKHSLVSTYAEAHLPEHCLEVQLPFLQMVLEEFTICPLLTGEVPSSEVARVFEKEESKKTIFIASSDLSHYNPYQKAIEIDSKANKYVPALDIENAEKTLDACGRAGILGLMHLAKKKKWKGKLLDYRNSGDTAGDKIRVVGYGCYAFYSSD